MASLVIRHASHIVHLFRDVYPMDCTEHNILQTRWVCMGPKWCYEVKHLFRIFNSEIAQVLHCPGVPDCDTALFLHSMQHIGQMLRSNALLFLWTAPAQQIYRALVHMVHGKCIPLNSKLQQLNVCSLCPSVEMQEFKKYFAATKKELKKSLCQMSAEYLSIPTGLLLQPHHPRAALDTLSFKELYKLVVNNGDKRLAVLFISMLPEMMGAKDISVLLRSLSMHMHKFLIEVVNRTHAGSQRKLIRLHFAAAGQCMCHTKCSTYGKVNDIQVLAVCKTCRNSPVFRQVREPRCRRTISSTSFMNVCTVDGNTSFIYVPLYRACVNKRNGQVIYEHWAYTLSIDHVGTDCRKAFIYMLCAGGRRTCTNVFLTNSLAKTKCKICRQSDRLEKTCLTQQVGNTLAALCDGCIIAACCPVHAPRYQTSKDVWLSVLEYFTKETPSQ